MPGQKLLLRVMYWYNIVVAGGFSLIILAATLFPDINAAIFWNGFDPLAASLIVPLFAVIAVFSGLSLKNPEKGKIILWMQVFYKPVAIALIAYFAARNLINPAWAVVTIAGLVIYIAGNLTALLWGGKTPKGNGEEINAE
jgi:hypothetical protein